MALGIFSNHAVSNRTMDLTCLNLQKNHFDIFVIISQEAKRLSLSETCLKIDNIVFKNLNL